MNKIRKQTKELATVLGFHAIANSITRKTELNELVGYIVIMADYMMKLDTTHRDRIITCIKLLIANVNFCMPSGQAVSHPIQYKIAA